MFYWVVGGMLFLAGSVLGFFVLLFCCSGVLRWLVDLAVDLACCSGLLLWLVALACPLCLPSLAGFDAIPWHYEILFKRRKVFKSLFRP